MESYSSSSRRLVVHCEKDRFNIFIGRPSKWENPFIIGKDGTRKEVIEKYRVWLQSQSDLIDALPELKGKILGCWCKPNSCHGDVFADLANKPEQYNLEDMI